MIYEIEKINNGLKKAFLLIFFEKISVKKFFYLFLVLHLLRNENLKSIPFFLFLLLLYR